MLFQALRELLPESLGLMMAAGDVSPGPHGHLEALRNMHFC